VITLAFLELLQKRSRKHHAAFSINLTQIFSGVLGHSVVYDLGGKSIELKTQLTTIYHIVDNLVSKLIIVFELKNKVLDK
jgi:hypothetical protein